MHKQKKRKGPSLNFDSLHSITVNHSEFVQGKKEQNDQTETRNILNQANLMFKIPHEEIKISGP